MVWLLASVSLCHVPGYECEDNCCHVKHSIANVDHPEDAISQAQYLRDDGGIEFDIANFNVSDGQKVHVDAVFKKEYPRDAFDLVIGCGGCHPLLDNFTLAPAQPFEGYGPGRVEPFTQHPYVSFFNHEWPLFDTSVLADCASPHWSIRLRKRDNESETIYWSAVVGRAESFTLEELFLFPIYVLRNHGESWNLMGGSILWSFALAFCGTWVMQDLVPFWTVHARDGVFTTRSILYFVAVVAISADILEIFWHFLWSVGHVAPSANEVSLFVGLVLLVGKGFPLLIVVWTWDAMRRHPPHHWMQPTARGIPFCERWTHPIYAHVAWAWIEIVSGLSFFLFFGVGFFVAPGAYALAGIVRLGDYRYTFLRDGAWASVPDAKENGGGIVAQGAIVAQGVIVTRGVRTEEKPVPPNKATVASSKLPGVYVYL